MYIFTCQWVSFHAASEQVQNTQISAHGLQFDQGTNDKWQQQSPLLCMCLWNLTVTRTFPSWKVLVTWRILAITLSPTVHSWYLECKWQGWKPRWEPRAWRQILSCAIVSTLLIPTFICQPSQPPSEKSHRERESTISRNGENHQLRLALIWRWAELMNRCYKNKIPLSWEGDSQWVLGNYLII